MKTDPIGWPWLRTPAATRLIDRLWPEEVAEQLQREQNEAAVTRHVHDMLDRQEADRASRKVAG